MSALVSGSEPVRTVTWLVRGMRRPSRSSIFLIRTRITRATSHCSRGAVLTARRMVMLSPEMFSTPHTSGSSTMLGPTSGSSRTSRASCSIMSATRSMFVS